MTTGDPSAFDDNALRKILIENDVDVDRPITRAKLVDAVTDAGLVGGDDG